jgi:hypothetical protein
MKLIFEKEDNVIITWKHFDYITENIIKSKEFMYSYEQEDNWIRLTEISWKIINIDIAGDILNYLYCKRIEN